ncbi:hypothetical protein QJS04_geneDACA014918 [Acorus gramineus]|uniref:Uncharacterized protein n=1 Tax=Acorus gramineus TaxID=55184 RepID=A0AAV9BWC3_ACOGR|nr:hypothetical protein QJS04_geneDACA014918 [Acorus gramineus]
MPTDGVRRKVAFIHAPLKSFNKGHVESEVISYPTTEIFMMKVGRSEVKIGLSSRSNQVEVETKTDDDVLTAHRHS